MLEITIINPIEQIKEISQAMIELEEFFELVTDKSIKTQCRQIRKLLTTLRRDLKEIGY